MLQTVRTIFEQDNNLLYNWPLSLCHYLETLSRCIEEFLYFRRAAGLLRYQRETVGETGPDYIVFSFIPEQDQSAEAGRPHILDRACVDVEVVGQS
jgi:hypothetical protein